MASLLLEYSFFERQLLDLAAAPEEIWLLHDCLGVGAVEMFF